MIGESDLEVGTVEEAFEVLDGFVGSGSLIDSAEFYKGKSCGWLINTD